MAITCSYNEKVKVRLQVIYCQTSFFGLSGIIVTLVPDININTNKKINMSTCFNMNIAICTVAAKQIFREYVVFILRIKYKTPSLDTFLSDLRLGRLADLYPYKQNCFC